MTTRWHITLNGDINHLRRLSRCIFASDTRIIDEGQHFYLELKSDHPAIEGALKKIASKADEIVKMLNGVDRLVNEVPAPISRDDMVRVDDDGRRIIYAFVSAPGILGKASMVVRTFDAEGNVVAFQPPPDPMLVHIRLGSVDPAIAKALRYFGAVEHNWDILHKIYEIIKNDIGTKRIVANGWATHSDIQRFTRTASHPETAGDGARHSVSNAQPPPRPMTLSDASAFIKHLLNLWLDHQALTVNN